MPRKKRLTSIILTLALMVGLFTPLPVGAADLYFTSLNDSLLPLTSDSMPVLSAGTIYLPYSVFDFNTTGINLGLYCSYSRIDKTVAVYNLRKMLIFDLAAGNCRDDLTGEVFPYRAIIRNNRPYLPVNMVCSFFAGLDYSYSSLNQGYLIRVKSDGVVLSDAKFIDAAGDLINRRLREYNQSLLPSTDNQIPGIPTVPTPPTTNNDDDTPSTNVRTYLAFRCEDTTGIPQILATLDASQYFGLFLLPPQVMEQERDLIRRILGTGHSVGVLAQGSDLTQTRQLLDRGSQLLEGLTHTRVTVASVPKDQHDAIEAQGWVCWEETLSLSPASGVGSTTFASATLRRLQGRTASTYLTLPSDINIARLLPTLLRQLESKSFVVSVPMETRL